MRIMQDLDLNLLRVFDTLIELRSVTRAAERLSLTQSAVSHALGRLRRALDDPLFLRSANGLQPTARAAEIAPKVREGLRQLRGALASPLFAPASATRRFTIAAGTYFCTLLVPMLVERLRCEAPGVTLHIVPITETLVSALDRGTIDLALAGYFSLPPRFVEEALYVEEMAWIAAVHHPLAKAPFDPAAIAATPRVMLWAGRPIDVQQTGVPDTLHEQNFLNGPPGPPLSELREDTHTVYDSQTAIEIVARTNLIALVPRRVAERAGQQGSIAILSPPIAVQSFQLSMFWHSRQKADAGLTWLRTLVMQSTG